MSDESFSSISTEFLQNFKSDFNYKINLFFFEISKVYFLTSAGSGEEEILTLDKVNNGIIQLMYSTFDKFQIDY